MIRIAIYARKSKYTGVGESIGNQIEMCKQYVKNIGLEEEPELMIYEDEGYSGKSLNRPNFQKLMQDNERQPFDIVIVYRLDRISRSVCDFMTLIEQYNATNTKFVSLAENFDTNSPMGKAMISICAVFAQLERETIAARIHDNMQMMAQSGYWTGGTTPLGYVSKDDKEEQKKQSGDSRKMIHKHHILQVDDENAEIVNLIYDLFLRHKSCKAVEKYLAEYGYKTRKDTYFDDIAIKRILTNPVYCEVTSEAIDYFISKGCDVHCDKDADVYKNIGFIGYNRTDSKRKVQSMDKWIVASGFHTPLISSDIWIKAQAILETNSLEYRQYVGAVRENNPFSLFCGLIYCKCGKTMRAKRNHKGSHKFSYICTGKENKTCTMINCNGVMADKIIADAILKLSVDETLIKTHLDKLLENNNDNVVNVTSDINNLRKSISEVERKICNFDRLIGSGQCNDESEAHFIEKINELLIEKRRYCTKLEMLENQNTLAKQQVTDVKKAIKLISKRFHSLPINLKRDFIRKIIKEIVWDGEKLEVFWTASLENSKGTIFYLDIDKDLNDKPKKEVSEDYIQYTNFKKCQEEVIRAYAGYNGISLRKLAEICNVSYTAVKKWLNNLCSPKYELYQRVFKDFYINIYYSNISGELDNI